MSVGYGMVRGRNYKKCSGRARAHGKGSLNYASVMVIAKIGTCVAYSVRGRHDMHRQWSLIQ